MATSVFTLALPTTAAFGPLARPSATRTSTRRVPLRSLSVRAASSDAGKDFPAFAGVSVKQTELGECRVRLEVTVPVSVLEAAYAACIESCAETAQIPGFTFKKGGSRKKKEDHLPPADILVGSVGEKEFRSACVEEMLQNSIPVAMQTVAATALQDSERIETSFEDLAKAFGGKDCAPLGDLIYSIGVEVVPTITWTGDYRKLKITVTSPGDDETDALEAESIFTQQLRSLGTMRVVTGRGLTIGDQVVMDLDAVNAATGDSIEGIKQKKFQLDTGAARLNLPGLIDAITGMTVGEERTFPLTMPSDWPQDFIRGVTADFTVKVSELFQNEVPQATDAMASKIFPEATTVAEAKAMIVESQRENTKALLEQVTNEALVDALAAICDAPLPESIIEETGRQMYSEKMLEMQIGQKMSMDVINQLAAPEMVESYLKSSREEIELIVRRTVACEELFKLENIEVTEEEFKAEVLAAKAEFEQYGTEYDVQRLVAQAGEVLEARKALTWLREHATITVLPPVK
uniref:peptidylprolyl isomerase n=1 Tax=Mantoniella antarctica TaxID=81844 RepID=A0A7S0SNE3_9CHLO